MLTESCDLGRSFVRDYLTEMDLIPYGPAVRDESEVAADLRRIVESVDTIQHTIVYRGSDSESVARIPALAERIIEAAERILGDYV